MSKLVCLRGMNKGDEFALAEGTNVIGRGDECDIALYDRKCSHRHCQLIKKGNYYSIEDLDSRNGTLLDRKPLAGKRKSVREAEQIQIGGTVLVISEKPVGDLLEQTATDVAADLTDQKFGKLMDRATVDAIRAQRGVTDDQTVFSITGFFRRVLGRKPHGPRSGATDAEPKA